jgi:hypothetical protein
MTVLDTGAVKASTLYHVQCFAPDGSLRWTEEVPNLVVNVGLNDLLDKYFKGSTYTAAWFVGLKGAGTIAAGDTLASHGGWSELTGYTGDRKALTLGSVSAQSVNNSASKASFAINATATVAGAFLCTVTSGTGGILYGAADFSVARSVLSGDTLEVTATLTMAAA